eukprot:3705761-Pleurochrysis_carterae.AAC.1
MLKLSHGPPRQQRTLVHSERACMSMSANWQAHPRAVICALSLERRRVVRPSSTSTATTSTPSSKSAVWPRSGATASRGTW